MSAAMCMTSGCLSPRFKHASKKTPPAVMLNVNFPPAPLQAALNTVIIPSGPGSWKKEAFWDEYVVTFHNSGDQSLQIASANLVDFAGAPKQPGNDPWKLERESKSLAKRYKETGMTVVRVAAPRALVGAAESSGAAATALGGAGAAAAGTAAAVALPVYGATVLGLNMHNRKAIKDEFNKRRLRLPLVLAPGETKTGSLFFPMVPNPQSLTVNWSRGGADASSSPASDSVLLLDFLQGLHVTAATQRDSPPHPAESRN